MPIHIDMTCIPTSYVHSSGRQKLHGELNSLTGFSRTDLYANIVLPFFFSIAFYSLYEYEIAGTFSFLKLQNLQQINLCLQSSAQARRQSLERLQTKLLCQGCSKYNTTLFIRALNGSQICNIELCKFLFIYITAMHQLHLTLSYN